MTDLFEVCELTQKIAPHLDDENFGRGQLGRALCMSRTKLFRHVKAIASISPGRFIRLYRLGCAKLLLETTDVPIREIAYRVGFRDPDYFSRAFRKAYGMQPRMLRHQPGLVA
jgi:AraC-like DNA-binding protein